MKFILGKKLEMVQLFDENGMAVPATLVQAGPCFVVELRTMEKDGYKSVQIGFEEKKDKKTNKAQKEQFKKANVKNLRFLKEFKDCKSVLNIGDEIKADIFKEGDRVKISGLSKGKGFAGVVKRHGFAGGPATHGQKHSLRAPGSIGSTFPERVPKGRRMAGRMGHERVTEKNLKIFKIDAENNIMAIRGALPGKKGTLIEISEY